MKFKTIIFDLDGVIIDSKSNMNLSWTKTAKKFGLTINFKQYKKYIGLPFKKILTKLGIKKNFLSIEKTYSQQSIINLNKIKLYPNIKKILEDLDKKKIPYSIVTSKDKKRSLRIIKKFKIMPKSLHTPNKKLRGKPYPDHINYCILKNKFKKKHTCYVGDTHTDYLASKKAGIKFIFASYGFGKNFKTYKYRIKNFKELKRFI